MTHYILDPAGQPVFEPDFQRWCRWFEAADRQVAETVTANTRISTVFLGLDHDYEAFGSPSPPPGEYRAILWETCVFGSPPVDGMQRRYRSREDALMGHVEMVDQVEQVLRARYLLRRQRRRGPVASSQGRSLRARALGALWRALRGLWRPGGLLGPPRGSGGAAESAQVQEGGDPKRGDVQGRGPRNRP